MMGRKQTPVLRKITRSARVSSGLIVRWWVKQDRHYRVKWRVANAFAALLIIMSVAIPVIQNTITNRRYRLSQETLNLVGKNNQALASKLTYNAQTQTYEFNKEAIKDYDPVAAIQQQVGSTDEKTKSLYALDVATDPKKGVTYHDVNSQLSFKLIPQFSSLPGKTEQGRIVYPLDNGPQAVYTLKNNGLKEDIIVAKAKQDALRFTYILELPNSLEARQLPDGSGAVGIYSGDPTLFSNMSYGSDKDRELVDKARENAAKTNLVFGIPAPVITAHNGNTGTASARFELRGSQLTVVAEGLKSIKGAFSIDPSVTITSASDFNNGNNEGNIDFSTSGQISRAGLTGGTVGTWNYTDNSVNRGTTQNGGSGATNGLIDLVDNAGVVTNNGVMYVLGGGITGGGRTANVERATINSNGTLGTWSASGTLPEARDSHAAVAYNGYIYISGGYTGGGSYSTDVKYAAICTGSNTTVQFGASSTAFDAGSDCNGSSTPGTLSAWRVTTSMAIGRSNHAMVVYNNRLFIVDGCTTAAGSCNSTSPTAVVYCADINGDGTVGSGSWNSCNTTGLSGRDGLGATVYNGFIYAAGGCVSYNVFACNSQPTTVQYAKINSDGSLSNWTTTTTSFTTSRQNLRLTAKSGYLYLMGGYASGYTSDVQYAPLKASGDIGQWNATTSFNTARTGALFTFYGDYLYVLGGCTNYPSNCGTYTNGVQFAQVSSPGTTGSYTGSSTYNSAAIISYAAVTTNGYIYLIGGTTDNQGGNATQINTARYAPVNADGTLGSWNTTSSNFTNLNPTGGGCSPTECKGRLNAAAAAYNGYIFLSGGASNGTGVYWSDIQSAIVCTGVNTPATGCAGAGDLRGNASGAATWTTVLKDFVANSTTTYSQTNARAQMSMQIYNGYMYLVGGGLGSTGSTFADIYKAQLTNSGGINGLVTATTSLPSVRAGPETFVANGRFYVVGGGTSGAGWAYTSNDINDVIFTNIDPTTGELSNTCPSGYTCLAGTSWVDANAVANGGSGSSFVSAATDLDDVGVAYHNGYLYIAGGDNGTSLATTYSTVYRAKLNTNGSMGAWTTITSMGSARNQFGFLAVNGFLYTIGGCLQRGGFLGVNCNSAGQMLNNYQLAQINNGGSEYLGGGSNKGSFTTARSGAATVAYNGYIYLIGGCTSITAVTMNGCTTSTTNTQYAAVGADGTLSWSSLASNPVTNRYGHAAVAYNGYLYVLGGCASTGGTDGFCVTMLRDVQRIKLNADGNTTGNTWASAGNIFNTNRFGLSATVYNGYIYVLGGCSSGTSGNCTAFERSVEYAQINGDGSLGSWASTGGSGFTTARYMQNAVAYAGKLYVLGGCSAMTSATCTTFLKDVQYATINSDGTVSGTWATTANFQIARYGASVIAFNGVIYIMGGCSANSSGNCTAFQGDAQTAPIFADGSLGVWSGRMNAFTDPRYMQASVVSNGYVYVIGGIKTGSTLLADSQGGANQLLTKGGRYSKLLDLTYENAKINNLLYNGNLSDNLSNITFKVATTASPTFSSSYNSPTNVDTACSAGLAAVKVRYMLITIILDDSIGGSIGGTFGETSTANLTDLTVRYNFIRPDPNIRLRHGQTLQQGDLSPFDTCQG
jgi:hypothetical protein